MNDVTKIAAAGALLIPFSSLLGIFICVVAILVAYTIFKSIWKRTGDAAMDGAGNYFRGLGARREAAKQAKTIHEAKATEAAKPA
jgi:hypothetical protein